MLFQGFSYACVYLLYVPQLLYTNWNPIVLETYYVQN